MKGGIVVVNAENPGRGSPAWPLCLAPLIPLCDYQSFEGKGYAGRLMFCVFLTIELHFVTQDRVCPTQSFRLLLQRTLFIFGNILIFSPTWHDIFSIKMLFLFRPLLI